MAQVINYADAIEQVEILVEDGWNKEDIFNHFKEEGFTIKQIRNLFVQSGLSQSDEKSKNDAIRQTAPREEASNPLEDALGGLLSLAIKYGIPLILIGFGILYVGNEISRDPAVGYRSAAAVIMPLAVTLAFAKSDARHHTANFLTSNKLVSFGFAFALAMAAAAGAMKMRQYDNVIPIGELAFSTTLSLMIFGNNGDGEVPMIHVGAVSGLLTYIVLFGIALAETT